MDWRWVMACRSRLPGWGFVGVDRFPHVPVRRLAPSQGRFGGEIDAEQRQDERAPFVPVTGQRSCPTALRETRTRRPSWPRCSRLCALAQGKGGTRWAPAKGFPLSHCPRHA